MQWRKQGVVWRPTGQRWWARSHATCPTPVWLQDGTLRFYVQSRDAVNVGRVGYVDVDPDRPTQVVRVSEDPVLDVGAPGHFDDNGAFQTSVLRGPDGRLLMYYVGFELSVHVRYRLLTGLAVSDDEGESFHRVRTTPILERSDAEPLFRCGTFVRLEGGRYRLWYVAGGAWTEVNGKALPVYDLRYLESEDGMAWPSTGRVTLPLDDPNEHGFGRPYVLKSGTGYQMFFSVRKADVGAYRMGYAESSDGVTWTRKDRELGLDVSGAGWDSESIAYPAVVDTGGHRWMYYNGNDFGGTGFGVAELIEE